jgi:hypothetical protein
LIRILDIARHGSVTELPAGSEFRWGAKRANGNLSVLQ